MRVRALFTGGLVLATLVVLPVVGVAQTLDSERGFVVGLGGMTATDVLTSPFFGASAGFTVAPHLQITADIGRMKDIEAPFTRQDLAALDKGLNARSGGGSALTSSVKVPTNYVTGGIRVPLNWGAVVRPYVAVSGGLAHMSPSPTFVFTYTYSPVVQDVTTSLMSTRQSGCAWQTNSSCVPNAFREETRPMASAGAGVAFVVARHLTFDVGYKYSAIFIKTDYLQDLQGSPDSHTRIDTHRVFAGIGVAY